MSTSLIPPTINIAAHDALTRIGACKEAKNWLDAEERPTAQAAWDACERGDWMLWILGRLSWHDGDPFGKPEHRNLVGCLVEVVISLAQPFWSDRARLACANCMEGLERYARGEEVSRAEIWRARAAAYADAAYAAAAADRKESLKAAAEIVRSHYPNPPVKELGL